MADVRVVRVLLVTDHSVDSPEVTEAVRARAEQGHVRFRVVVPRPARAELHPFHPERHAKAAEAELVLITALPALEEAAGGRVLASVSVRADPMDAVEETLLNEPVDEIMLAVTDHPLTRWLHQDLAHRLRHYGLPLTVVDVSSGAPGDVGP